MKKILTMLLILVVIGLYFNYRNSNPHMIISGLNLQGALENRQLKYRIYLLGVFPAGEAILEPPRLGEYQGKKVYHLSAEAESLGFLSKIFRGQVWLYSLVDVQDFNPLLFKQKISVADKADSERQIFYDQKNNVMAISGVRRQILSSTQDPLSLIFNIRRMDFTQVKDFTMNINTNQKNYLFAATVKKQILALTEQVIFLTAEVSRRDKNPYHRSKITVAMLKDKANLPIFIRIFASGFLIHAKLVKVE